jgi:hypothetical protein
MAVQFIKTDPHNPLTNYQIVITLSASSPDEELQSMINDSIALLQNCNPRVSRDYSMFLMLLQAMIPDENTYKGIENNFKK